MMNFLLKKVLATCFKKLKHYKTLIFFQSLLKVKFQSFIIFGKFITYNFLSNE